MNADDAIVRMRGVRFSHDGGETWTLDGVDLTIRQGEWVCLVGSNGSGKSTLSRLIAGLAAPDEGEIGLFGETVFDASGAHADAYRRARRSVGAVFQNPEDQIITTVVEDDVAFGPENLAVEPDVIGRRIRSSLQAVGMDGRGGDDPTRMSGGQQQRVAIADMLAMDSRLLVLDEPTAMLDAKARAEVMRVLGGLHDQGTAIVLVTHHEDETARADRTIRLERGKARELPRRRHDRNDGTCETEPERQARPRPDRRGQTVGDASGEPMVRVRDLSYRYPQSREKILDDFSLTIRRGETVALMGHNGSGKTTLARLLCALDKPESGEIAIDGIDLARMDRKTRKRLRASVGYVMQHPERQLFAPTVAEDIAYGPRNLPLDETQVARRVERAMRLLRIEHLADRSPFELSCGQQRLVAMAGVLACEPDVLIMDEPTAGLDDQARQRVYELIRELRNRNVTMLIISHSQAEARTLADRIIRMDGTGATGRAAAGQTAGHPDGRRAENTRGPLSRLDPRATMVCALALMFGMFAVSSGWQLLFASLTTGAALVAGGINLPRLVKAVRALLALFVFCGLLNIFFVRDGTVVAMLGPVPVTDDGIRIALLYACRFALVIILGAAYMEISTPTSMAASFESLLSPLSRFGMHPQEMSLVLSLALRFLPMLGKESKAIVEAQSARGGGIETGSPFRRARAMAAIVVPVLAGTVRHAENLSLALDARCYETGEKRTHWHTMRMRGRDFLVCYAVLAYLTVLIAMPTLPTLI